MSNDRQDRFERAVTQAAAATDNLILGPPRFERDGYVTRAFLEGADGQVELCCGPPDYSVEIFINSTADARRWTLADLMQQGSVSQWLIENRPQPGEQDEAYALRFLSDGLRQSAEFVWLHARSQG